LVVTEEKNWEAKFEPGQTKPPRMPRLFSWAALVVASVYAVCITWVLSGTAPTDGEAIAVGWVILAFPWILVVRGHPWFAIPLNALTLYFLVLAGHAVFRMYQGVHK